MEIFILGAVIIAAIATVDLKDKRKDLVDSDIDWVYYTHIVKQLTRKQGNEQLSSKTRT